MSLVFLSLVSIFFNLSSVVFLHVFFYGHSMFEVRTSNGKRMVIVRMRNWFFPAAIFCVSVLLQRTREKECATCYLLAISHGRHQLATVVVVVDGHLYIPWWCVQSVRSFDVSYSYISFLWQSVDMHGRGGVCVWMCNAVRCRSMLLANFIRFAHIHLVSFHYTSHIIRFYRSQYEQRML